MKDPIKLLEQEHEIIFIAVEISKQTDKVLKYDKVLYEHIIRKLIDFFKIYADIYHHSKEENILFPAMNKKHHSLEDGIVKEMLENHEDFRVMVKKIETYLDSKDFDNTKLQLHLYTEALLDHIEVENMELFHMAETLFEENELENLFFRFKDSDKEIGETNKLNMVNQLIGIKQLLISSQTS